MARRRPTDPSLPLSDARDERMAQILCAGGISNTDAHEQAGFQRDRHNASRTVKRIAPRVEWLQARSSEKATDVMAAAIQHKIATQAWITEKLVYNARVCLGELPIKRHKLRNNGKIVAVTELVHIPSAANKALELLGLNEGMFKTDAVAPPPEENSGSKTAHDPKIVDQLERYRKKGLAVVAGQDKVKP